MQSYTEIPSSQSLQSSLALLLNNDKTALSCSSGSAFPTSNLQVGMLCFRTDQNKLYILKDATPTWMSLLDLNTTGGSAAAVAEAAYSLFLRNNGAANEGGEMRLQKAASGSTLTGDLTIDLYQNQLRIYDSAGTNKGFYIDLATGAAGVATKIWHSENDGASSGLDADLLDGMQTSSSGDRWGVVPFVAADGVMEVGKIIDFHETDADTSDYTNRLTSAGTGVLQLNGQQIPVNSGTAQTNLNADMVDGYHASSFVRSVGGVTPDASGNVSANYVPLAGGTMTGGLAVSGTGSIQLATTGDITCYRSGGTTGVIFLNQAGTRYVYFDGTNYNMPGADLVVNGVSFAGKTGANTNFSWAQVWTGSATSAINCRTNWGEGIYRHSGGRVIHTTGGGVMVGSASTGGTTSSSTLYGLRSDADGFSFGDGYGGATSGTIYKLKKDV